MFSLTVLMMMVRAKLVPNESVNVLEPEYGLWVDYYRLIAENFVTKAWFIKLRDVNLTYSFSP